ncbi:MAG: nucleotidyltransferase domain-containing protein [Candidatus Omnitrophica bacterium]|nr:nucleotidyltransferase domain-containing protein [Candidatus Omnitrophota bacterium]
MEKKQYELCVEVLRRFNKAGILDGLILIGSWCLYFYKGYFKNISYIDISTIRTRDIDFLVPIPARIKKEVDIPKLLEDLGFVIEFKGSKGYIKLDHPDLIVEFLVPEKGRGSGRPYKLPQLGMNATPLRFLSFLTDNVIRVKVEDFYINVPHPANFALHKLIIFSRRAKEDKALKDKNTAIEILKALFNKGEVRIVKSIFNSMLQKWQKKILDNLDSIGEQEIAKILIE